ncbi:hypothetical protein SAMN04488132_10389 [Sediminibacterium ginsengisoli]|uniref:Uncharacterized protein n=2 Tax=Sediminibacterium ginsengisoli TaxID=413434 RepID=A0A1T4M0J9_9BACT|nr:hypothetical protein SAMN04488132_10389 [Sediminibacterium ginsengisoli]
MFQLKKFDFGEIQNAIQMCYPADAEKETTDSDHCPASQTLSTLIAEQFYDNGIFFTRWNNFTDQVAEITGLPLQGTTYGQAPSFSAFITLEKQVSGNFTRTKELHFFISIAGKFYTVIGKDNSALVVDQQHFRSTTCMIISPVHEYATAFQQLTDAIEKEYSDYRFVPFEVYRQPLRGLTTGYADEAPQTVFEAIFDRSVLIPKYAPGLGDAYYKSENWRSADYVDDGSYWIGVTPFSDHQETGS